MKRIVLLVGMLLTGFVLIDGQTKLDDKDIADVIENHFVFDHAVNVNKVDVEVTDGIAELTGEVSNLKAKERAANISQLVKGVRSVSNRIEIDPSVYISDQAIRNLAEQALLEDPATELFEIDVDVTDKVINLTGTVESYQEKQLAANVAKSVKGVTGIENNIDVDFAADRTDYEIKNEIEAVLAWDAMIDDGLIDVKVKNGRVVLEGSVSSAAEKTNAAFDSWVAGVKSVDNSDLKVEWWLPDDKLRENKDVNVSDAEVADAIDDATIYDPRVNSFDIVADVELGWATLRGNVDNLRAKKAAELLAENTYGVKGVTNRIKVKTDDLADTDIRSNIGRALAENAITESGEIAIAVNDGIATLGGIVDSYLERTEATWVASNVEGVNEVNNNLEVSYPYGYYWYGYYPFYDLTIYPEPKLIRDDNKIRNNVLEELGWSPYVDLDDVTIKVDDGIVSLLGEVDSYREYREAETNAFEAGAYEVENELVIK